MPPILTTADFRGFLFSRRHIIRDGLGRITSARLGGFLARAEEHGVVCSGKALEVIEATPLSPTNEHDQREKEFVFLSRDPRSPEQVKQLICRAELFSAPTYFFTDTIGAFVNSKAFRFTGGEREKVAAGAVLKLYWNCPIALANGTSRPRSGDFVFRDDVTWLPLKYGIAFGNSKTLVIGSLHVAIHS